MKRITYLVASLLLAGTTPMLTGCVDNDEPAGIEELRSAKAELLSAKAAVEAAKVATEQANAAYRNAEAEYVNAQAAYLQAQIAQLNAQTEAEKAAAEQALAEAKAKAEQAAQDWELSYQTALANYQALLISLATQNSTAIDGALASYREEVKTTKAALEAAAKTLREEQRDFNEALEDLEADEAKRAYYLRALNKEVIVKERAVEGAKETLAEAEAEYEEAQSMELADLAVKRDELQAEINNITKEIADLGVAAAETVYGYEQTIIADYKQHEKDLEAQKEAKIEIPAFVMQVNAALPLGEQGSYNADTTSYSLLDPTHYNTREAALNDLLETVESWIRDEDGNDDLWTAERIAKLESDIETTKKDLEATKTLWSEAVAAYNTNKADVTDPTKVTGYTDLKTTVDAYNTAAAAWNAVNKKIYDAEDAIEAAEKTYEEAVLESIETRMAAEEAAAEAKETADATVAQTAQTQYAALKSAYDAAVTAETTAYNNYIADPTNTTLHITYLQAVAARETAKSAYMETSEAELAAALYNTNVKTYNDAVTAAETAYTTAVTAAQKTRDDAVKAQKTIITDLTKEGGELEVAEEALDDAVETAVEAFGVFYTNASETTLNSEQMIVNARNGVNEETGNPEAQDVDIAELTDLSKEALTEAINTLSNQLYGTAIYATNEYGDFTARLKEISDATIKAAAEEKLAQEEVLVGEYGAITSNIVSLSDYVAIYNTYGLTGSLLGYTELIELAKQWMTNDEAVVALVDSVKNALEELVETKEAAQEAYDAAEDALWEEWYGEDGIQAKLDATIVPIEAARAKSEPMQDLLNAYIAAINDYIASGDENYLFSEEALTAYVETCKTAVTTATDALYDAETALMAAENAVADYESSKKSAYELASEALEEAQAAYEIAEENYNAALQALSEKIAALSVE